MNIPIITISEDIDTGTFTLMATSYSQTMPAGERLFRAPPHPDIRFTHTNVSSAEKDAAILRDYIARTWGKKISKTKERKTNYA